MFSYLLGKYITQVGLPDFNNSMFNFIRNCFSKCHTTLHSYKQCLRKVLVVSQFHQQLVCQSQFQPFLWCVVISPGFNLYFPNHYDIKSLFMCWMIICMSSMIKYLLSLALFWINIFFIIELNEFFQDTIVLSACVFLVLSPSMRLAIAFLNGIFG